MAEASDTRDAIYDAILKVLKDSEDYEGTTRAAIVRDAAMAFRLTIGGPQPGGAIPPKD